MAQTRTYSDLIATIQAKSGNHHGFNSTELTSIKQLVNSRIQDLFLETEYWENIMVIGEERAVDTSTDVIPYTGAVVDDGVASPYSGGSVDTFLRAHKTEPWDTKSALEYKFAGVAQGARLIGYKAAYGLSSVPTVAANTSGTVRVRVSDMRDYYVGGTVEVAGFATGTVDINGIHTVTAVTGWISGYSQAQYTITDTTTHSFSLTGSETIKAPIAYATYKKRIIDTVYGDGSGETTAIPLEWFECVACGVVADLHSGDGNESAANKWEGKYQRALDLRLERIHSQLAAQTVGISIHTHLGEQGRAINF